MAAIACKHKHNLFALRATSATMPLEWPLPKRGRYSAKEFIRATMFNIAWEELWRPNHKSVQTWSWLLSGVKRLTEKHPRRFPVADVDVRFAGKQIICHVTAKDYAARGISKPQVIDLEAPIVVDLVRPMLVDLTC